MLLNLDALAPRSVAGLGAAAREAMHSGHAPRFQGASACQPACAAPPRAEASSLPAHRARSQPARTLPRVRAHAGHHQLPRTHATAEHAHTQQQNRTAACRGHQQTERKGRHRGGCCCRERRRVLMMACVEDDDTCARLSWSSEATLARVLRTTWSSSSRS
eukprot:2804623-Rhodomonas_salina.1